MNERDPWRLKQVLDSANAIMSFVSSLQRQDLDNDCIISFAQ